METSLQISRKWIYPNHLVEHVQKGSHTVEIWPNNTLVVLFGLDPPDPLYQILHYYKLFYVSHFVHFLGLCFCNNKNSNLRIWFDNIFSSHIIILMIKGQTSSFVNSHLHQKFKLLGNNRTAFSVGISLYYWD